MADRRIVILTEGRTTPVGAKTASCVVRYKPKEVVALFDTTQPGKTAGELLGVGGSIPIVAKLADAPGANTLLIGIAPSGGKLPPAWRAILLEAIDRGMNLVSGLHDFLSNDPEISAAAAKKGVEIHDVRKNNEKDVSNRLNLREDCLRIHTVGQDCSVGKMLASVELAIGLKNAWPRREVHRHGPNRHHDRRRRLPGRLRRERFRERCGREADTRESASRYPARRRPRLAVASAIFGRHARPAARLRAARHDSWFTRPAARTCTAWITSRSRRSRRSWK